MIREIFSQFNQLVKGGFLHLFFSNFLIQFMVFGSQMLVAGMLLPEDFGRIKVLQTYVDVASIIGGGGFIVAVLKLVPESRFDSVKKFVLNYTLAKAFVFSIGLFLILNVLAFFGLTSTDQKINSNFYFFSVIILFSPISLIMVRYFQALDKFKKVSYIQTVSKFITIVLILILTHFYLLKGYLLGVVLGFVITFSILFYFLRESISLKKKAFKKTNLVSKINRLSKFNFFAQVSDQFRVHASFFIANYLVLDRDMFGQYSFALILVQGLGVLSSSVQQFMIPKFSKYFLNGREKYFVMLRKNEKNYFLLAILIFLVAQVIFPIAIELVFGDKYLKSIPYVRLLLVGWLFYSAYTLRGPALIGLGRLDISFKISLRVLLFILPVSFALCYYYKVYGVAFAYIYQTVISLVLNVFYFRKLKTNSI